MGLLKLLGLSESTFEEIKDLARTKGKPIGIKFRVTDGILIPNNNYYEIAVLCKGPLFSYCKVGTYQHLWVKDKFQTAEDGLRGPDRRGILDVQNKAFEKALEVATDLDKEDFLVTIMDDSIEVAKEAFENHYRSRL